PGERQWAKEKDLGTRWLERGDPGQAASAFERALALEPDLRSHAQLPTNDVRAALYFNYAVALRSLGRSDALSWFQSAAETAPDEAHFVRTLADAYLAAGREREGHSLLSRVEHLVGATSELLLSRGYRSARTGRLAEAESLFTAATDHDARDYAAWGALIRVQ